MLAKSQNSITKEQAIKRNSLDIKEAKVRPRSNNNAAVGRAKAILQTTDKAKMATRWSQAQTIQHHRNSRVWIWSKTGRNPMKISGKQIKIMTSPKIILKGQQLDRRGLNRTWIRLLLATRSSSSQIQTPNQKTPINFFRNRFRWENRPNHNWQSIQQTSHQEFRIKIKVELLVRARKIPASPTGVNRRHNQAIPPSQNKHLRLQPKMPTSRNRRSQSIPRTCSHTPTTPAIQSRCTQTQSPNLHSRRRRDCHQATQTK